MSRNEDANIALLSITMIVLFVAFGFAAYFLVTALLAGDVIDEEGNLTGERPTTFWPTKTSPEITWKKDRDAGHLDVVSIDREVPWNEVYVEGCQHPADGIIRAGDRLELCQGDVEVIYRPTGDVLFRGTYP